MTKKIKIITLSLSFLALLSLFLPAHLVSVLAKPVDTGGTQQSTAQPSSLKNNPIVKDINSIVNFLSIGVGVVVIAMLIVGGIQYSIAGDNPQAVNAAKQRLINAAIALIAYIFIFAFLQWLIPGGVFNK